jgi:hypothetical protein
MITTLALLGAAVLGGILGFYAGRRDRSEWRWLLETRLRVQAEALKQYEEFYRQTKVYEDLRALDERLRAGDAGEGKYRQ